MTDNRGADDEKVVVGVLYPAAFYGTADGFAAEISALEAVDPRIEVVVETYIESHDLRSAKGSNDALAASMERPPITDALRDAFGRVHAVIALDLPDEVAELAPNLRWVQAVGAGTGQLRVARLNETGIRLTSNGGANGVGIAEFVIGRILAWAKHYDELAELQRQHDWDPRYGREISGMTLGLIGYGGINEQVATRLAAFNMRILAMRTSKGVPPEPPVERFYGPDELHELLAESDIVVAAVPDTPATRGMFDDAAFAAMKPGSFFANVGRGTLVDEPALQRALESGHLGAAALDVASREPLPADDPLWDTPRLWLSPHCSSAPMAMFPHVHRVARENLRRFLDDQPLHSEVRADRGY